MDREFVAQHLLSGFIPMIPVLMLYFFILNRHGKEQTESHVFASFILCFYLTGVLALTGIYMIPSFSPSLILIPFIFPMWIQIETFLNILLFMPLGILLPMLYRRFDSPGKTVLAGLLVSLCIEFLQIFEAGNTDVNDLITNAFGTWLGYKVFRGIYGLVPQPVREKLYAKGLNDYLETALFWICSLIVMLTVQIFIFNRFFA